jgi:hypothetical protein
MPTEQINLLKEVYIPIFSSIIALVSVSLAFLTLKFSRKDRDESRKYLEEQEKAAEAAFRRKQQEEIFAALQGGKESVGFMALQLSRKPDLVLDENRDSILNALCLAFIFDKSKRARALILKALKTFSSKFDSKKQIIQILKEIKKDFRDYEKSTKNKDKLNKYYEERIQILIDEFTNNV